MNAKQRRAELRRNKFWIGILGEIADDIENGKQTPQQVAEHIRDIQRMVEVKK